MDTPNLPIPEKPQLRLPQLRLFEIENPLRLRVGSEFFKELPQDPGVYWMLDGRGRLLYIGKSRNLKKRLSSYRSLRPEKVPPRLQRLLLGAEQIHFQKTDSETRATEVEALLLKMLKPPCNSAGVGPDKVFDWVIHDCETSWRLEIETRDGCQSGAGFRSPPRVFKIHGAILRQLHGLTRGSFSVRNLPTALLKGPAGLAGTISNFELREMVEMYLTGVDTWPERPCPASVGDEADRWSVELWTRDQTELREAFEKFIQPRRMKQFGVDREISSDEADEGLVTF